MLPQNVFTLKTPSPHTFSYGKLHPIRFLLENVYPLTFSNLKTFGPKTFCKWKTLGPCVFFLHVYIPMLQCDSMHVCCTISTSKLPYYYSKFTFLHTCYSKFMLAFILFLCIHITCNIENYDGNLSDHYYWRKSYVRSREEGVWGYACTVE